jgi:hypothetical protein
MSSGRRDAAAGMTRERTVEDTTTLSRRVSHQMDDVFATIHLVGDSQELRDELFGSLVDLLVEQLLLDLAIEVEAGRLSVEHYEAELATLGRQCRIAGLLG